MKLGKLLLRGMKRSSRVKFSQDNPFRGKTDSLIPVSRKAATKILNSNAPRLLGQINALQNKHLKMRVPKPSTKTEQGKEEAIALASPLIIPTAPVFTVLPREIAIQSHPLQTPSSASPLTTGSLIRPDERLLLSIEGFLLDQRSPHTKKAYGKDLKRFVKFLVGRGLDHTARKMELLDRSVLIAYKDSLLSEGLEHTTIDRHLAALRSFFKWLVDDGILSKSPAEGVRFLNPKRVSRTNGFTDEEVKKILKLPNLHTRTGSLHYAVLMILFYCGLRRSEVCELRTSNLGTERGHTVLRLRGKGNAERVVVVIPAVKSALDHYFLIARKDPREDQPLFSPIRNPRNGVLNKPLDSSMIFYIVKKFAREAGIANRVSPHSCRATAISNARDHQVPDRAIQEFAGWASPDMITRYDKRKNSVEKSAAHAIAYGEVRSLPTKPIK